jgi:hypothetical protein
LSLSYLNHIHCCPNFLAATSSAFQFTYAEWKQPWWQFVYWMH